MRLCRASSVRSIVTSRSITCAVGTPGDAMISRPSPRSSHQAVSQAGPMASRVMASRAARMILRSSSLRRAEANSATSVRMTVQVWPASGGLGATTALA